MKFKVIIDMEDMLQMIKENTGLQNIKINSVDTKEDGIEIDYNVL